MVQKETPLTMQEGENISANLSSMSSDKPECCHACGRLTERGREQRARQLKPIFGTDLSKPVSELLTGIRSDLCRARGQLDDIGFRYSGFRERLASVEGLLTCGLVTLYYEIENVKKWEAVWGDGEK